MSYWTLNCTIELLTNLINLSCTLQNFTVRWWTVLPCLRVQHLILTLETKLRQFPHLVRYLSCQSWCGQTHRIKLKIVAVQAIYQARLAWPGLLLHCSLEIRQASIDMSKEYCPRMTIARNCNVAITTWAEICGQDPHPVRSYLSLLMWVESCKSCLCLI